MADVIDFDFDDLTIEEVEVVEEITGVPIDELQAKGTPRGKTLRAIVYIVRHRENPDYTIEDAGREKLTAVSGGGKPNRAARRARPTTASA